MQQVPPPIHVPLHDFLLKCPLVKFFSDLRQLNQGGNHAYPAEKIHSDQSLISVVILSEKVFVLPVVYDAHKHGLWVMLKRALPSVGIQG